MALEQPQRCRGDAEGVEARSQTVFLCLTCLSLACNMSHSSTTRNPNSRITSTHYLQPLHHQLTDPLPLSPPTSPAPPTTPFQPTSFLLPADKDTEKTSEAR